MLRVVSDAVQIRSEVDGTHIRFGADSLALEDADSKSSRSKPRITFEGFGTQLGVLVN